MSPYKVIASLHYQLAEAYDALAREQDGPAPKKRVVRAAANDLAAERAVKLVQVGLRKQGFKTS